MFVYTSAVPWRTAHDTVQSEVRGINRVCLELRRSRLLSLVQLQLQSGGLPLSHFLSKKKHRLRNRRWQNIGQEDG